MTKIEKEIEAALKNLESLKLSNKLKAEAIYLAIQPYLDNLPMKPTPKVLRAKTNVTN